MLSGPAVIMGCSVPCSKPGFRDVENNAVNGAILSTTQPGSCSALSQALRMSV